MEIVKTRPRSRKVIDYAAMNDVSDDSDEEFLNPANKLSSSKVINPKPSKLSKLKLRVKRDKSVSSHDEAKSKVVTDKPTLDEISHRSSYPNHVQDTAIRDIINLSVPEPDLMVHSLLSQETVIVSSCECTSSQELSDSSFSISPASPTRKLSQIEAIATPEVKKIPQSKPLNEIKDRVEKRRIVNETSSSKKKKKTRIDETTFDEEPPLLKNTIEVPVLDGYLKTALSITARTLSPSVKVKETEVNLVSPKRNSSMEILPATDREHFQNDGSKNPPSNQTEDLELVMKPLTSTLIKPSEKEIEDEFKSTTFTKISSARMETKDRKEKRKLKAPSKPDIKRIDKRNTQPLSDISDAQQPKNQLDTLVKSPIKNFQSNDSPVNFKSPTPPSGHLPKTPVWNPPGMARGSALTPTANSPAIGLRLGLSRNRKAYKPLHPDVKLKN